MNPNRRLQATLSQRTIVTSVPHIKSAAATLLPYRRRETNAVPRVALENLSLEYKTNDGSQLLALENIQMDVHQGEFLCIVGPSGCGKSTLLHLIAG
ncbi:MAG TPA: ATP-binding cassette domain-containing protein, partial [Terriglobales bacterium]|nr:ATP-binding cassette domain-containing protein [Terriglobales bacterium]